MHQEMSLPSYPPKRNWAVSPKDGVGTAYYDPTMGESLSNVWYTLSGGILTEVFYPDVGTPNLLGLQFAVTDGLTVDYEDTDMVHETELINMDALVYRQINTSKFGHYQIVKTYITNPYAHALMIQVQHRGWNQTKANAKLFLTVDPAVSGTMFDDKVQIVDAYGTTYFVAFDSNTAFALTCSAPLSMASDSTVRKRTESLLIQCDEGEWISSDCGNPYQEWTVCIGFGDTVERAIECARQTVAATFTEVLANYKAGWKKYMQRFNPPEFIHQQQYLASLMIMKAHEDKIHPGAVIASFSTPWEPSIDKESMKPGGYHLVWARDLCHIASAFAIAGDSSLALRVLQFLDKVLQLEEGTFPQNAWPDGSIYWGGQQLDQVAYPILLAYQLSQITYYETMVRPAADYLVAHGPFTQQERWEENAGYSPSTLAAEIAALVVASEMAVEKGDVQSANRYITTADKWEQSIEKLVVTKKGKLSANPYYVRVSGTDNPDDGEYIYIQNGGGLRDKTEVIDAGFLELVRLGIRRPDDPIIIHSLTLVDEHLRYESSIGPIWRRYPFDGYGEYANGDAYNGSGIGRPWPLLTGERGEFEIAWLLSRQMILPRHLYGPVTLLQTLAKSARHGWMIPEQIWDDDSIPDKNLYRDYPTHCASPLVWALAQYIRLAESIRHNRLLAMPMPVYKRYAGSSCVKEIVTVADFLNDTSCSLVKYPKNRAFHFGDFELQRFSIQVIDTDTHFKIYLGHLDNPWLGPNGLSKQIIDIYLNTNQPFVKKRSDLKDVNAMLDSDSGWDKLLRITGGWAGDTGVYSPSGILSKSVHVFTNLQENLIHAVVPSAILGGVPKSGWQVAVTVAGEHLGQIREVGPQASDWTFGRFFDQNRSLITDFLEPEKGRKLHRLRDLTRSVTEIPLIRI